MHISHEPSPSNRRHEPRYASSGETVVWQRFHVQLSLGRLHDVSHSGASFFASDQSWRLPDIGEEIRIRRAGIKWADNYEVVRLEQCEGKRALVACQKAPPKSPAQWHGPRERIPAHAAVARQKREVRLLAA